LMVMLGVTLILMRNHVMNVSPTSIPANTTLEATTSIVNGKEVREVPTLDLQGRALRVIPMNMFDHSELVVVNLAHNNLTGALPAEVRHLQNLEWLDLSHNQFTGVPAEMGQLLKLHHLDLSYNKLTGLPNELGDLQNLETLILTGNEYSEQDLALIISKLPATVRVIR
ncbi:MAG: hypothetical protein KBD24_03720, partial [Candidatus Pacebacteria bacterium]|nr:hypothetical protein [Candidatus Paceibacterota bacterium]